MFTILGLGLQSQAAMPACFYGPWGSELRLVCQSGYELNHALQTRSFLRNELRKTLLFDQSPGFFFLDVVFLDLPVALC